MRTEMPDHEPGFPRTTANGDGKTDAKVAVYEVPLGQLHEETGEDAHFDPQGDRSARRRAIVEPQ